MKLKYSKLNSLIYLDGLGYRNDYINEVIYEEIYMKYKDYCEEEPHSLVRIMMYYVESAEKGDESQRTISKLIQNLIYLLLQFKLDPKFNKNSCEVRNRVGYNALETMELFNSMIEESHVKK